MKLILFIQLFTQWDVMFLLLAVFLCTQTSAPVFPPAVSRKGPGYRQRMWSQPLGRGTQVGTWIKQLSSWLWLTDCSLGSWAGGNTAKQTVPLEIRAVQLISCTISLAATPTQTLQSTFTHLCSHSEKPNPTYSFSKENQTHPKRFDV